MKILPDPFVSKTPRTTGRAIGRRNEKPVVGSIRSNASRDSRRDGNLGGLGNLELRTGLAGHQLGDIRSKPVQSVRIGSPC